MNRIEWIKEYGSEKLKRQVDFDCISDEDYIRERLIATNFSEFEMVGISDETILSPNPISELIKSSLASYRDRGYSATFGSIIKDNVSYKAIFIYIPWLPRIAYKIISIKEGLK